MTLLNDFIIVDNFFEEPDIISEYAKMCSYYENTMFKNFEYELNTLNRIKENEGHPAGVPPGKWRGYRSQRLHLVNRNLFLFFLKKLKQTFIKDHYITFDLESYFHFSTENIKPDDSWLHSDLSSFAGVIYLTKNPPKNSGTILKNIGGEDKVIENVYNRLLMYNASIMHRPDTSFGNSIDNSRLTLTFYVDNIKIKSKYSEE